VGKEIAMRDEDEQISLRRGDTAEKMRIFDVIGEAVKGQHFRPAPSDRDIRLLAQKISADLHAAGLTIECRNNGSSLEKA